MKKLTNLLISGAISLCVLMPAAGRAGTLLVEFKSDSLGVDVTWEQSTNPMPLPSPPSPAPPGYIIGQYTDIPISNFTSKGLTLVPTLSDVIWINQGVQPFGGGFNLASATFLYYGVSGPQAYTGLESAPVFDVPVPPGFVTYNGTEYLNGNLDNPATYTLTLLVPGPAPGAGLAGLAALALAGLYARTRRA